MGKFLRNYWSALVLAVVAIAVILTGVLSATVFRPDDHVTATLPKDGEQALIATRANTLELVDSTVTITVESNSEAPVQLIIGRSSDVSAWLDKRPFTEITGLSDWKNLRYSKHAAAGDAEPLEEQDLNGGSDMWLKQVSEPKKATLVWTQPKYPTSLLAYSDGVAPVKLTLSWEQEVQTPLLWPMLIIGIVLLLAAIALAYVLYRLQQHEKENPTPEPDPNVVAEVVGEPGERRPSRRALREARAAGQAVLVVDGKEFPTGTIPKIVIDETEEITKAATSEKSVSSQGDESGDEATEDVSTAVVEAQSETSDMWSQVLRKYASDEMELTEEKDPDALEISALTQSWIDNLKQWNDEEGDAL